MYQSMYNGCSRLSIINTEGQRRIFLMTPVGVVMTSGCERVKVPIHFFETLSIGSVPAGFFLNSSQRFEGLFPYAAFPYEVNA